MPRSLDKDTRFMLGPEYLDGRQHLMALVAEAIARWSSVEHLFGNLLARIFHTSPVAAVEMYLGISQTRRRKH